MERLSVLLGVAFAGALGCAPQQPAVAPKNAVFVLRYLEMHPQALVADDVHPFIAELQLGLLDFFDDAEDRRLLSIDPRRTAGAQTSPLARRLVNHAPEQGIEAPPPRLTSEYGTARVQYYVEACKGALAKGVDRAELVERTLRLFDALVVQAREDPLRR